MKPVEKYCYCDCRILAYSRTLRATYKTIKMCQRGRKKKLQYTRGPFNLFMNKPEIDSNQSS